MRKVIAGIVGAAALGTGGTVAADRAQNPYTDRGTHYELPIHSDIPQGDRVEISKNRPEMTLYKWNDELAVKITPNMPEQRLGAARAVQATAKRPLLSKRMEFQEGDVTAFIEPRDNPAEFDIDFTLESKPDTNVFTYTIEGAEDLDFFYQPELTPEEIAEGAERPENVVGSYAVYHKTKANHRVGGTNYATGKAFHIYRPKAIDADGAEVWAELNYENGVLSVTVPEKWLETAVYPVVVDPTFGNTDAGPSTVDNCAAASDISRHYASAYTLSEAGNLDLITVRYSGDASNIPSVDISAVINRKDSGGADSHALVVLIERTSVNVPATAAWYEFTGSSQALSADDYLLGSICDGNDLSTFREVRFYYDVTSAPAYYITQSTGSSSYTTEKAFDPWTIASSGNRRHSIYATYTVSGGAEESPTSPDVIFFD